MSKYDRFDLEAEIHSVWDTEKDLDTILYRLMDSSDGPCNEDDIANMLIGLKEIHKSRCLKLWDMFETMIKDKCFVSDNQGNEVDMMDMFEAKEIDDKVRQTMLDGKNV